MTEKAERRLAAIPTLANPCLEDLGDELRIFVRSDDFWSAVTQSAEINLVAV
jgi:hypothetical protein|tara:strand:- start:1662 stop:1817 length:156 start_codon:yes stop_codon:yes gene_type:complete